MASGMIGKRCVFSLVGYEPLPPERQYERFKRELGRFEATWNVSASATPLKMSENGAIASWSIETRGPNWSTGTDYHSLRWDDFVAADFKRSAPARLSRALLAFADFIVLGTAWRYFRINWRYGLFFLYPVLILIGFAAVAHFAAAMLARFDIPWVNVLAPLLGVVVFILLYRFAGPILLLNYILDDWIFAQELARRSRAALQDRMEQFSQAVAAALRSDDYDEIILAAHSLGNAWQLAVADRALALAPPREGQRLLLLSTGSSLLKVALHQKAGWLVDAILRVARHPNVFWVEYHALADVISFYKTNPVAALTGKQAERPVICKVRIRHMLQDEVYERFRGNFFRLHRQLGMGNDKRYFYDYFMICCGPFALQTRTQDPELMIKGFAADGSLIARDLPDASHAMKV